ncbi:hypothetical protein RclHR1_05880003 [Rhizophagus clarus]|uniref:HMG box domain-containing protein n=1 Tax=Rhizophagus clarus TaxID=94130 RepID=A0A2Z6S6H6_9GLOM|nr:hypothetical protein RclHR1_05880003 [Rhizophagus clarus]GES89220.1 hypothetical protein GLOIN_2v1769419 [Rhizophagus clarus]
MSQSESELKNIINKNLNKMIEERGITIKTNLSLKELLKPSKNRIPLNSFMLYCKDHSSIIINKPGENSKTLSQMWDSETTEKRMIYSALSDVMATAYKEVFTELKPWERSASMATFCLNQKVEAQDTQKNDIKS